MLPFLKWPGGKRWLVQSYPHFFESSFERYVEPFLGGAATFFALRPRNALLSDINPALIGAYYALKEDWKMVEKKLKIHQRNHHRNDEYYYEVRASNPTSSSGAAAKFIYLNRTCFNGIYRVNLQGEFNVPRGTKDSVFSSKDNFQEVAKLLSSADLKTLDFEEVLDCCGLGDFVFVDPPYTVAHNNNGFLKYNEKIFSWDDQLRLAKAVALCADRGAKVIVTNASHSSVRNLYSDVGEVITVSRFSKLGSETRQQKTYRGACNSRERRWKRPMSNRRAQTINHKITWWNNKPATAYCV